MLKIYDRKEDIPENLAEFYQKAETSNKYEPKIEGIRSISGIAANRDELIEKVRLMPKLKDRIAELEAQETLSPGKIAVDKKEFQTIKAEHEAFTALGAIDEIKPKVEGYNELREKDETRTRQETYRAAAKMAGFDEDKFILLADQAKPELIRKSVSENGKTVEKYFVKSTNDQGKESETALTDYVTESPTFKPFADSLTMPGSNGTKVIKQGTTTPATPTLETEVAAARASGIYGL